MNNEQILVRGRGIKISYGRTVAVDASDFQIPNGKITAVIGPNGSGKSTLLQAIAGVITPDAGQLRVFDRPVPEMQKRLAFVMQSVVFPTGTPITVKNVVEMGRYAQLGWFKWWRKSDREAVKNAMATMKITDLAHRHLDELSGGQRQRAYVAQGLAQDHEVLILDEPMTGLDIGSAQTIDHVIHHEAEHGHTVIMTTHDLEEAAAADYVLLLNGRVVAEGTPDEVLTRENLETAYGLTALHSPARAAEIATDAQLIDLPQTYDAVE